MAEIEEQCCEDCGSEGEIGDGLIRCPRLEKTKNRKILWIHKKCCATDQLTYQRKLRLLGKEAQIPGIEECSKCEQGKEAIKEGGYDSWPCCESWDCDVDFKGLTKEVWRGIPVYVPPDKIWAITNEGDRLLELFKPLNIVTSSIIDEEAQVYYVKDHKKNITAYSLQSLNEIEKRLPWGFGSTEKFRAANGPLCILSELYDNPFGAMLAPWLCNKGKDIKQIGLDLATKFRIKYFEAEKFFGVDLAANHETLKCKIQSLSENAFIQEILVPVLKAQDFQSVKPISFHGPGECGGDFHPFYKVNEFGKIVYYSAQAKAVKIHATSGKKEGNVNQLIDELKKLFRTPFPTFVDNTQKRITQAFVFCSQDITKEASDQLFNEFEERQQILLIDIDDIVDAVLERGLASQILDSCMKKETIDSKL